MPEIDLFDDIRPYSDAEVKTVVNKMVEDGRIFERIKPFFPGVSEAELRTRAKNVESVRDLQIAFSLGAVNHSLEMTSTGLTTSGFEELIKDKAYLFLSIHRDIVLDSAILNSILVKNEMDTVEIATGDNLFMSESISNLMRLNRSFVIKRPQNPREIFAASKRASQYIRKKITEEKTSVWLAQRGGRTKDGNDRTETGLVKMLNMSGGDFLESFAELNIMPLAISYEYDPCDIYKVRERYIKEHADQAYAKTSKDDLKSMLSGIYDHKGRIHFGLDTGFNALLTELATIPNKNERMKQMVSRLDQCIFKNYKLWPGNYIAADLLSGQNSLQTHYTFAEKKAFEDYISKRLKGIEGEQDVLRKLLLEIYANPAINVLSL